MSTRPPRFSVVTPVYDPPADVLEDTIASVTSQSHTDWEWIIVDDHSPSAHVLEVLRRAATRDRRIRLLERDANGGISVASNDAIAAARGEHVVLLDHDDLLTSDALATIADVVESHPDADYIYSDEDKVDADGRHLDLFRKPSWSPERLRHQMYTAHLSVLRTSIVREVGGFDPELDGSQDHDLVLKVTEKARRVVHVPRVLYHWRVIPGSAAGDTSAKPYAWEAGRKAVQAQLDRLGMAATARFGPVPGYYAIDRSLPDDFRVSLVIPTRGTTGLVWGQERSFVVEAVRSCLAKAQRPGIEVVVVYDARTPQASLEELKTIVANGDLVLVPFEGPFNFSRKCNLGVLASSGDAVVLLNDDVEAKTDGWLEQLVAPLLEHDVGMTGARLLFSDGTLQHGGHAYSQRGYLHIFYGAGPDEYGAFGSLVVNRECSGVTAACAAVRRDTFDEVGGLTETLPASFNDVDFSMKITHSGYRILWMAGVELYHFESKSRNPTTQAWEQQIVEDRWDLADWEQDPFTPDYA